jgi:probable HAF family extracellular repeat protein
MTRLSCVLLAGGALYYACATPPVEPVKTAVEPPPPPPAQQQPPQPPPPPAPSPAYQAIDLGTVGGASWASPSAIRDDGTIVGTVGGYELHAGTHGFVWANGVMRELPGRYGDEAQAISPSGKIAGQEGYGSALLIWDSPDAVARRIETTGETHVLGINARGDVVANVGDEVHNGRAIIWKDDQLQELGGLEGTSGIQRLTLARAWNARGQVVGISRVRWYRQDSYIHHPFIWENGVMRDLGVLTPIPCEDPAFDCADGEALDINQQGTVVGNVGGRAFVWENGVMRDLDAYPGQPTSAVAINDRGQILGMGPSGWFVWDRGTVRTVNANRAYAWAFGAHGEVVGDMVGADDKVHAFIWQDGVLTDLGPGTARAINDRGDIIGARGGASGVVWSK